MIEAVVASPAIVEWVTSKPGLYTQSVAALLFQLVGVALVVDDVRSARRRLNDLYEKFAEIDMEAKLAIKRTDLAVFDEAGQIRPGVDFEDLFAAPFLTMQEVMKALGDKTNALAEQHDRYQGRAWTTWIGPISLLLGIMLSFTAAISAI